MRAVLCNRFGPIGDLKLTEVAEPEPGPGQVRIAVHAAGANFFDTLLVQGRYQARPPLPFIPGGEAAGIVEAMGSDVDGIRIGDRVVAVSTHGAFAEKMLVPATHVHCVPEQMDDITAAGFGIAYATSHYALTHQAGLAPGETLLVLGAAGGVGRAAVELGRALGARVIAAASSAEKLDVARAAGAQACIDYSRSSLREQVRALTDGTGVDVIYDPVGGDLAVEAMHALAWGGRYLVVGFASGKIPDIPLNIPLLKGAHIVGVFWGSWTQREPEAAAKSFADLFEYYKHGRLQPLVSRVLPLEEHATALHDLSERRAKGKIVLQVASGSA